MQDRMEKKYGKAMYSSTERNPRISGFEELVPHLTDAQVEMLLSMAKGLVRDNRKRRA